ncbi:hypothetical protein [Nocardia thailandica]
MKPISTSGDGVIAPTAAEEASLSYATAVSANGQAVLDVPLVQLPADLSSLGEEPVFALARKIVDDGSGGLTTPAGLSGLSGLGTGTTDAQDILSGVSAGATDAATGLFDGAQSALTGANTLLGSSGALTGAQTALDTARSSLGLTGTSSGTAASAAASTITEDPVSALLSGISIPALPGVDTLFEPILSLLSSFGTGVFSSLDPTSILSNSSSLIDTAISVAQGGLTTVQQLWDGDSADAATTASKQAQASGTETSQRGVDIAALTEQAAAVVQAGNAQLTGIATTFATQATVLAPTIMLPTTQTALIALATEHLGSAVTVVNTTRGELAGKTAELTSTVQSLVANSGLPSPDEVASTAAQNIGEPLLEKAQSALSGDSTTSGGTNTTTAGTNAAGSGSPTTTSAAGLGTGGKGGTPSTGKSGGGSPSLGALGSTGSPTTGTPKAGASVPGSGGVPAAAVRPVSAGLGSGAGTTTAGTGNSFMGGGAGAGAGAGRGGNDDEHGRTVQPYQSRSGNDDLTGPLGESTPEVIGATSADEAGTIDESRF